MDNRVSILEKKKLWPWLAMLLVLVVTAWLLYNQGRFWICTCGYILLWAGDIWSSDNSQHIFDPYTFTHVLHGFAFAGFLALVIPKLAPIWQLWVAITLESVWEIVENSSFIIDRYRTTTLALGYTGDTIINSVADIIMCGLGFAIARYLGFRRALVVFIITEIILSFWIRDSLLLNIIMLIYPIDAIRTWQLG